MGIRSTEHFQFFRDLETAPGQVAPVNNGNSGRVFVALNKFGKLS